MVNWKKVAGQAKKAIDQRGGTEALKQDLKEVQEIAKGKGTLSEKAKAAGEALKQPGATTPKPAGSEHPPKPEPTSPSAPPASSPPPPSSSAPPASSPPPKQS